MRLPDPFRLLRLLRRCRPTDEHVWIFHHIPKCGGTSMKAAFARWFRRYNDYRPPWASGRKLERFRDRRLELSRLAPGSIVCGHFEVDSIYLHQRYPEVLDDPRFRLVTFVREPLSLRLSLLRHEIDHRRRSGDEPIQDMLLGRPNWLAERFPCTADTMEQVLDRYCFIGLTERSQEGFDHLAGLADRPPIPLPRRNRTRPRALPVTDELLERFREVHALDYRIYAHCRDRWLEQQGERQGER